MSKAELDLFPFRIDLYFHLSRWSSVHPVTQSISELLFIVHSTAILLFWKYKSFIFQLHLQLLSGFPLSLGYSPSSLIRFMGTPHDQPLPTSPVSPLATFSFIHWTWIEYVLCARHYYKWTTAVNKMDLSFSGVQAILIYPLFPFTSGPICIKWFCLESSLSSYQNPSLSPLPS